MAYKTPNKTCEYIRSIMHEQFDKRLLDIVLEAEALNIPIILPEAAAFLVQLLMLKKPKNVLEIGTAIGYSGSIFLLNSDCFLTTIDKNLQYLLSARGHFNRLGFDGRYKIIEGDSNEIIPTISDKFDFIFLDGAKTSYIKCLPYLSSMLNAGGILLCDNVLFNGMVAGECTCDKKQNIVSSLDRFLRELYLSKDFKTSVLNVGDGLSLSIKITTEKDSIYV